MDKKIIKQHLTDRFITEAKGDSTTPGIAVTKNVTAKAGAQNKKGVADMEKELSDYDKDIKKTINQGMKYNYNPGEKEYHDQMEIMNGQEMIRYDRVNDLFQERALEAIEGSSRMGNEGGIGNAQATWGASSDDFGKNLVKNIKASTKKRADAEDKFTGLGDDVEIDPSKGKTVDHSPRRANSAYVKPIKESDYGIRPLRIFENYETGSEKEKDEHEFYSKQKHEKPEKIEEYSSDHEFGKWAPASQQDKDLADKVVKASGDREEAERAKAKAERLKAQSAQLDKHIKATHAVKEEDDHIEKGKFTAWCKANGFEGGPSESCARKAMAGGSTSAHKMATFYMNTVQPHGKTTKDLEETDTHHNDTGMKPVAKAFTKDEKARAHADGEKKFDNPYKFDKDLQSENNNNKKPQIKESMKRLNFKKEFNGVGNALKMIPESYKVNEKTFEMTDGNESYKIRWEGTLNEGRAVILMASNKTMLNEDILRMKKLMGYKAEETLGTVKGAARLTENTVFGDFLNKTRTILESEDIESQHSSEGEWDDAGPNHAKEAKADVEGSVATDKKVAPNVKTPKTGEWEDEDPTSSEASADVEGSVKADKKIAPNLTEPKKGYWEEIKPGKGGAASEATAHLKEGIQIGNSLFRLLSENFAELEEQLEEEALEEEAEMEEDVLEETDTMEENLEEGLDEDDNEVVKKK